MQKLQTLKDLYNYALDFVFPPICPGCGAFGAAPCSYCQSKLKIHKSECGACRKISKDYTTHNHCREYYPFSKLIACYQYDKITRKIIAELKYKYVTSISEFISTAMAKTLKSQLINTSLRPILVPVPLHPRRKRERGFNQTEIICKKITKIIDIPTVNLIRRIRNTKSQMTLDREKRLSNLKNAFIIDPKTLRNINPDSLLIITDDIVTTGTTLTTCAKTLKSRFKFNKLWGLAFARRAN